MRAPAQVSAANRMVSSRSASSTTMLVVCQPDPPTAKNRAARVPRLMTLAARTIRLPPMPDPPSRAKGDAFTYPSHASHPFLT